MKNLNKICDRYDDLPLECDGLSRVLSKVLSRNRIEHRLMIGTVTFNGKNFPVHFWIELPDGRVVDYRLRMWFGDKAPHGVFRATESLQYEGEASAEVVSDLMFDILTSRQINTSRYFQRGGNNGKPRA